MLDFDNYQKLLTAGEFKRSEDCRFTTKISYSLLKVPIFGSIRRLPSLNRAKQEPHISRNKRVRQPYKKPMHAEGRKVILLQYGAIYVVSSAEKYGI